jgi:hypothetical protein
MSSQRRQQDILKNFIIIWLDPSINDSNPDFQHLISKLRCITKSIKTFVHIDPCIDFLTDIENEQAEFRIL